jgi:hypothetical protein
MKPLKKAILSSWIMLLVCFIIKLFGGNWFEIICKNEHFIQLCTFIDNNLVISDIIAYIIYIPSTYFLMLAMCLLPNPNKHQKLLLLITMSVIWATRYISSDIKFVGEIFMFIGMPMLIWRHEIRKSWYYGIIGFLLNLVFQLISILTRNLGVAILDDSILITLFLMIDYYFMIALYYLNIKCMKGEQ